jgi:tetratricopeptide (TPR) repeat protein
MVFISYAHEDADWLEKIQRHLEALKYGGHVDPWDDRRIVTGADWETEICAALDAARLGVLLISPAFFNSKFIQDVELPRFLTDPRRIFWIPIRGSSAVHTQIGKYQAAWNPETPLEGIQSEADLNAALVQICERLLQALKDTPGTMGGGAGRPFQVPYPRNPFFTGREEFLAELHRALTDESGTVIGQQAIAGLGGVGKTQTAVEYAYRHREVYEGGVYWVTAETESTLLGGYGELARLLKLPAAQEADREVVVAAVKRWLAEHTGWLLILDNADEPQMLAGYLPAAPGGRVLITTRAAALGPLAQRLELNELPAEEGAAFVLRRAGALAPESPLAGATAADLEAALALTAAMDGLPLALDQAGAYMEETQCAPGEYLALYHESRAALLERRGELAPGHASVTVTFSLAGEQLQACPAAADLLRFCAFLAPDAIPEEIFTAGAEHLPPALAEAVAQPLQWRETLREGCRYSLLERDADSRTLSLHRLVQEVVREGMGEEQRREWAERVVRVLNAATPEVEFEAWPLCDRLLPHQLACAEYIDEQGSACLEAARLLNQTAEYLGERAQYSAAEPMYRRALAIREREMGDEQPQTATSLNDLAGLLQDQGNYAEAEPLYRRALAIRERALGTEHPDTATSLSDLGVLLDDRGDYAGAETLHLRALAICEKTLGAEHRDTATSLNNLATLLWAKGDYAGAEQLFRRALTIREKVLGPEHPDTAATINDLAWLLRDQGDYVESEALLRRAIAVWEHALGPEHPHTAVSLNNLALVVLAQGDCVEAEALLRRALAIRECALGPEHPDTASSLSNLATLRRTIGDYAGAEPLLRRALSVYGKVLGPEHPLTGKSLHNMALLLEAKGDYAGAESLYRRALAIREQALGPEHPDTAASLNGLASLLWAQGDDAGAEPLYRRALAIAEKTLGPMHPTTQVFAGNLRRLLDKLGRPE